MINNSSKLFEEIFSEEIISNESFRSKVPTGIIVFAGLFFTASGFFSSMRTVLNKVNGTYVDINFFLGKLRDLLVNLFAILLFFASILALHLLELIISIAYSNS